MNYKLSMTQHCIETEIKKRYNKAIFEYFKEGSREEKAYLEKSIDAFQNALETFNFGHLRNLYPDLRGNSDASVTLYRDQYNRLRITINGEDIEP